MKEQVKVVIFMPTKYDRRWVKLGQTKSANSFCSFSIKGIARFKPEQVADPAIGKIGEMTEVHEERIEFICDKSEVKTVIEAIKKVHSYEEIPIDVYPILVIEK